MDRQPFNYSSIQDAAARASAEAAAAAIRECEGRSAIDAVRIGQALANVRDSIAPGTWLAWLDAELEMVRSTAFVLIAAYRRFGQLDCLGRFQRGALIELARDQVAGEARKAAIALAKSGQFVTRETALKLVDRHAEASASTVRLPRVANVSRRDLHRVRSSLRRIVLNCPPADRQVLRSDLEELLRSLLAELQQAAEQTAALAIGIPI